MSILRTPLYVGDLIVSFKEQAFLRVFEVGLIYPNGTEIAIGLFSSDKVESALSSAASVTALRTLLGGGPGAGAVKVPLKTLHSYSGIRAHVLSHLGRRPYLHGHRVEASRGGLARDSLAMARRNRSRPLRHNLTREERIELGVAVRAALEGGDSSEVVELLNDQAASESIADELPRELDIRHNTCGHFSTRDESNTSGGTSVCHDCLDEGCWVLCVDDDSYHDADDATYDERSDSYYADADNIGGYRDDYDDDDDDDSRPDSDGIYEWGVDAMSVLNPPPFRSTPTGEFTLGMEFECLPPDRSELAEDVVNNHEGYIMCKTDGSLPGGGLELVFAPMALEDVKQRWLSVDFPRGTSAWDSRVCGTHVHIDSRAFTRLSIAKFIAFWNAPGNAGLIRRVAGRHPNFDEQARSYAAIVPPHESASSIVSQVKNGSLCDSRYRAVNLTTMSSAERSRLGLPPSIGSLHANYNTVELRIFRASRKAARTLAQVEMAHATVVFAREGSASGMTAEAFLAWLKARGQRYGHLRAMLGIVREHKPQNAEEAVS